MTIFLDIFTELKVKEDFMKILYVTTKLTGVIVAKASRPLAIIDLLNIASSLYPLTLS